MRVTPTRPRLLSLGSCCAAWILASALASSPLHAQEEAEASAAQEAQPDTEEEKAEEPTAPSAQPAPPPGVEEIVVFGELTPGVKEDVAESTVTFSMEDLRALGTVDIRGLSAATPNLEIKTIYAASNPVLFIRGVGLKDYLANASSAVAVWNDEIYMNSPTGQLFQLFDVESVDVLRGPQALLHGRNASAGAILVEARKPTGELGGDASVEYGTFDVLTVTGAIETPIIEDVLSARGSFQTVSADGWMHNRCAQLNTYPVNYRTANQCQAPPRGQGALDADQWVNDQGRWAARGLLRFQPTEELDWVLNVHGGLNRSGASQFQTIGTRPDGTNGARYFDPDLPSAPINPNIPNSTLQPTSLSPLDGDPFEGDFNLTGEEDVDLFGTNLRGTWSSGDFVLTSITGYAQNKREAQQDADASSQPLLAILFDNKAWQVTQDVRFHWDAGPTWWFDAGAWGLHEKLDVSNVFETRLGAAITQGLQDFKQTNLAYGAFLGAGKSLSDEVSIEGGVRFNWDRKDFDISTGVQTIFNGIPTQSGSLSQDPQGTWSSPTGQLVVKYQPLDDLTFYAKYVHGFKTGQFNGLAASTLAAFQTEAGTPVDAESVDTFETGWSSWWWDQRLMLNAALFYTRYKDQQVFQLANSAGAFPTPKLLTAGDAQIYGLELDAKIQPWEWGSVGTGFGLLKSEYINFTSEFDDLDQNTQQPISIASDYAGNQMVNAPQFAWTGNVDLKLPLSRYGFLTPRFDWSFKSEVFFDPNEGKGQIGAFPKGTLAQDDLWLLNFRMGYMTPDEKIEVAGWVRNLTDEAYIVDGFDVSVSSFEQLLFFIGQPRFYGFTATYRF